MESKVAFLGLRIPNGLYTHLKELANQRNITVSDFCREHLERVVFGSATLGNGQSDPPLIKADLDGLLTKDDLAKLARLFFSVFLTERLLLKTGNNSKQLLNEVYDEAEEQFDKIAANLGITDSEAKAS